MIEQGLNQPQYQTATRLAAGVLGAGFFLASSAPNITPDPPSEQASTQAFAAEYIPPTSENVLAEQHALRQEMVQAHLQEAARQAIRAEIAAQPTPTSIPSPSVAPPPKTVSVPSPNAKAALIAPQDLGANQLLAKNMAAAKGWTGTQWSCLDQLWTKESHYNVTARNSKSGAYGIPQSFPGNKMASVGADWRTNPATQITWGLNYISARWTTPCNAWNNSVLYNSY